MNFICGKNTSINVYANQKPIKETLPEEVSNANNYGEKIEIFNIWKHNNGTI